MTNVKTPDQWEAAELIETLRERRAKSNEDILSDHSRALVWIIRRMDLHAKSTTPQFLKSLGYGLGLGLAFGMGKIVDAIF